MIDGALVPLLSTALGVGVIHTLVGPDHYVPLLALARERRWGTRRAHGVTAGLGLLHCATGTALAIAVAVAGRAFALADVLDAQRNLAAMLLIGLGVAMGLAHWRGSRRPARGTALGALGLAFALGPCEWLVPAFTAAAAAGGFGSALLVAAAFTAATVATMLAAVAVGLAASARLPRRLPVGAVASAAISLCGAAMWLGA